jgi:hypothetical protein
MENEGYVPPVWENQIVFLVLEHIFYFGIDIVYTLIRKTSQQLLFSICFWVFSPHGKIGGCLPA